MTKDDDRATRAEKEAKLGDQILRTRVDVPAGAIFYNQF